MAVQSSVIDLLLDAVSQCLIPEVARRIIALRADAELQSRIDELADKANAGTLTDAEQHAYEQFITYSEFVTLLQIKARDILDRNART